MKILKIILDLSMLFIIFSILFLFSLKEEEELIPDSNYVIKITEWDFKHSKESIYKELNKISKENDISIYKVSYSDGKNETKKYIYPINSKEKDLTETFNSKKNKLMNFEEVLKKDVRGNYFVKEKNIDNTNIQNSLLKLGIKSDIIKISPQILFISLIADNGLLFPILSLFIIYILYFLKKVCSNFKEIAIKKLNGYSNGNIIFEDFHKKILYYISFFAIFIFATILYLNLLEHNSQITLFIKREVILYCLYLLIIIIISIISYFLVIKIDIPSLIKGQKPYKQLRIISTFTKCILLLVFSIIYIGNYNHLKELSLINESKKIWNQMDDYYTVDIAPIFYKEEEKKILQKKFHNLIIYSEKTNNTLLIRNNNVYNPSNTYSNVENSKVLFINKNFIDFYGKLDQDFSIKTDASQIEIILPVNSMSKRKNIELDVNDWIKFQQDGTNINQNSHFISKENDYKIYSFDTRTMKKYSYIYSPVILVIEGNDLGDDFYYTSVSQGSYLFKNYDSTIDNIKKFGLENYVSSVTSFKDKVNSDYKEIKIKYLILLLAQILNIVTISITILFDIKQYFDQNKKLLLIKKIHGYSILHSNITYILLQSLLIIFVGISCYFYFKNIIFIYIMLIFILFQFVLQIIYIYILEKNYTKLIKEI
ncbi:DUF1430 domain-containing protein [Macrococcoides caseolyticum]|uniref:DUF1430 domain-containing protein n=1 Tax=Macrococcoides caseolyticum TaxID=69966 RepID=UPI000C31D0BB|nr:DUF1430 domain-containing protein [Macrococcus caseolyticus]PKE62216.1 hypothetical protein CW683_11540 [Macrococcus caseolyticus]TDM27048.1 DUF1430 domain-containing protein [Macrococcus caseolyticus]